MFEYGMVKSIDPGSPLFKLIGELLGFHYLVGPNDETLEPDPKHLLQE